MDKYLAKLHKKPDRHKKQFALLASGTITLFIFGIWSLATFGTSNGIMAKDAGAHDASKITENEISPLQSFRSNLASSLEAIKSNFEELQSAFQEVDFQKEYQEMKEGALKFYGQ
ncbi:MAG: hypothetical protein HYX23_00400 [Candidatus Zambryskibacteria bacterium]|nr:hypothetical protein [Candidatus Zambryskibacteria bacterium]